MLAVALAACALSTPLQPRARLHVIARGSVPFGEIQSQIKEVTNALARLTKTRTCNEENGCLLVDITWAACDEEVPMKMQMSLIMAPPTQTTKEQILHERVHRRERAMRATQAALDRLHEDK